MKIRLTALAALLLLAPLPGHSQQRPRARALGVAPGIFTPGPLNAITDVKGVLVGQRTIIVGDSVRTGVTAILPHAGNLYRERVPAALRVFNGFGKLLGATQLNELGELETPILLTCTLCVWKAADAMVEWMLGLPDMSEVRSINAVVGETNDGGLNAIRSRPIDAAAVRGALTSASAGAVEEGNVGAGTGTVAFGWKGGIGTSSRKLPAGLGSWTVGVLVQTNFGGVLQIMGAPIGQELGQYPYRSELSKERGDGSVMIIVATDAPLSDRNLGRLAERAVLGLARTGSGGSNGSGDYVLAFSNADSVRRRFDATRLMAPELSNNESSALFQAVAEATEEAIYNSLFAAQTTVTKWRTIEALPLDKVRPLLLKYRVVDR